VDHLNAVVVLVHAPVTARMDVRLARRVEEAHARDPRTASTIAALAHPDRSYDLTIAFSPPHEGATMRTWLPGADRYEPQSPGEMGVRIGVPLERALERGHARAVVVDTHDDDHPVTRTCLEDALQWLEQVDCVIGATLRHGFWIVGARRPLPALRELPWGTPDLLERMRERLVAAELSWCELDRTTVVVGEPSEHRVTAIS
jgi:glycosyltransferase A (GT-A) superfamily protein (DUF2064 family)